VRSAAYLELGRDAGRVVLEGDAGWLVQSANTDATAGAKAQILTLLALAGKGACASASRGAGRALYYQNTCITSTKVQILTAEALRVRQGACASASRRAGRTRGIPAHVRPRGHRQGVSSSLKAAGSPDVC
jgi:hypothetical protein